MKKPDLPANEQARVKKLHALEILDTEPEERFERITRLARSLFQVPMALVSLVDERRQWFKSHQGIDVKETPREVSFCGHTICGDTLFEIENALEDTRFLDNPLVVGSPDIRFYAGVPISTLEGYNLGTLCIIDTVPRSLSEEQKTLLMDLAKLAEQELIAAQAATEDGLTLVCNRYGFDFFAEKILKKSARYHTDTTLMLFDLNDFGAVNDNFGHLEGDALLKTFAKLLVENFRECDVVGRMGGDEFLVLMDQTHYEAAKMALARFDVAVKRFNETSALPYRIMFNAGVASTCDGAEHLATLFMKADSALNHCKQNKSALAGGNCY